MLPSYLSSTGHSVVFTGTVSPFDDDVPFGKIWFESDGSCGGLAGVGIYIYIGVGLAGAGLAGVGLAGVRAVVVGLGVVGFAEDGCFGER
ncbi:unnamed protein product [Sphagnum balticum]